MAPVGKVFAGCLVGARAGAKWPALLAFGPPSLIAIFLLAGCADASLTYSKWDGQAPVQSTSVKFALQQSAVTLQGGQASQAAGGQGARGGQDPVPCDVKAWGSCFKGVSAQSAPSAPELVATSPQPWQTIWVATPDSSNLLATTAISGTPIAGQDALYSIVTIKMTSKTASVVTAAGTGAATGFGIGGPYGAALGGALGAGTALAASGSGTSTAAGDQGKAPPSATLQDYLCPGEPVDLSNTSAIPAPTIQFPITLKPTPDKMAPATEADTATLPTKGPPNACWHTLPNPAALTIPRALRSGKPLPAKPISGDGWLYRVVASDDLTQAPTGPKSQLAADFFGGMDKNSAQEFPYSSCRKATLQVAWWKSLDDAAAAGGAPQVLTFSLNLADPRYVYTAQVKKGGVINFKTDCGANVSITPDTSAGPILNAVVTQGEAVYKAEQTWANGSKK